MKHQHLLFSVGDRCMQVMQPGLSGGDPMVMQRWYYDQSGQCRQFNYNGLQGNENNFLTQAECNNACFGKNFGF
jgi:hypothetical protein